MEQEIETFPTLRRWRRMSESEQDALLDTIEARRRWRTIGSRAMLVILCLAGAAIAAALIVAT